jgi:two-component system, OmpR family, sensor histidine kinase TctE
VSVEHTLHSVVLSVTDNGAGVPADKLQQISQRWVQGAAGEALKAGAGLGLAIVGTYAKLLGARVTLAGAQPHGLCVRVTFDKLSQ